MTSTTRSPEIPGHLATLAAERVVDVDVREDLRAGREPFSRIAAARRDLPPGSVLRVRAIFEPVPLYAVMERQGLHHWTERLDADDWRVWFHPPPDADGNAPGAPRAEDPGQPSHADGAPAGDTAPVILDVRGLEPPEPMVRTLAALACLPPGGTLVQLNDRVPRFLLPEAERRGFACEVREQEGGPVRVFFRHAGAAPSA